MGVPGSRVELKIKIIAFNFLSKFKKMPRYNFSCGKFSKYFKTSGLAIASLLFIGSP